MATFILTWNPELSAWDREYMQDEIDEYGLSWMPWSTGPRKSGIEQGDRIYMLKQGPEPRGLVARGTAILEIGQGPHWGDSRKTANYVDVDWDTILNDDEVLPLEKLKDIDTFTKRIQSSGNMLPAESEVDVDKLWDAWIGGEQVPGSGGTPGEKKPKKRSVLPGSLMKKLVEIHAHEMLMDYYRERGWEVEDTSSGNPFDAIARMGGKTIYLEAKGTQQSGEWVNVTANEVEFAREHEGDCFIGIVSGIRKKGKRSIDRKSGTLRIYPWNPEHGALRATAYRWRADTDRESTER